MRYRSVALPPEHGGWGLLFEPILIGLVAAPTGAGAFVAGAAMAIFLARQPLKIVFVDRAAGRRVPRTRHAAWFALGYVSAAAVMGLVAVNLAGTGLLIPVVCAAPLATVQLAYDARNRSRELFAELCGAAALAASAAAIAVASEWPLAAALALWVVAAARTVPAMVTVRARVLRLHLHGAGASDSGSPSAAGTPVPLATHAVAMGAVYLLQRVGLVPRGVLTVLAVLAARAGFTLRASAPRVRAQRIGIEELVIGLLASAILGWLCRG